MSQRARRPTKKQAPKKQDESAPATSAEPTTAGPPVATDRPDWAIATARHAVDVAAHTNATSPRPVPVPGAFQLDTGLVDYGMWIEMFTNAAPPAPPEQSYRRGQIWS